MQPKQKRRNLLHDTIKLWQKSHYRYAMDNKCIFENPKEIWEELERLYAPKDCKYRIVQLRRKLHSQKISEYGSMEMYLGQINSTVAELAHIGDKIDDDDLAMTILCGLSEEWDAVVSLLCNLPEEEFNCSTVKRRLIAEDSRRRENNGKQSALIARKVDDKSYRRDRRNENFTEENNARKYFTKENQYYRKENTVRRNPNLICYNCNQHGHIARFCPLKSKQKNFERKASFNVSTNIASLNTCGTTIGNSNVWIIDSGATHHMSPNETYFTTMQKTTRIEPITTADDTKTPVVGTGTINAELINNDSEIKEFEAKNTLVVPGIRHGILSVKQLTETDKTVVFDKRNCRIYDSDGKLLLKTKDEDRLYTIKTVPKKNVEVHTLKRNSKQESLDLWHRRLMHVNKHRILKMIKTESARDLNCEITTPTLCEDCLIGKATRQKFPVHKINERESNTTILNLVHSDLMGPFDVPS